MRGTQRKVTINGTEYNLELSLAAMWDFEAVTGKGCLEFIAPLFDSVQSIKANLFRVLDPSKDDTENSMEVGWEVVGGMLKSNAFTAKDLACLVWACLGGEDSKMQPRDAAKLVTIDNYREIYDAVMGASEVALTSGKKAEDTEAPEGDSPNA